MSLIMKFQILIAALVFSLPITAMEKRLDVAIGSWPPYVDEALVGKGVLIKLLEEAYGDLFVRHNFDSWGEAFESTVNSHSDVSIGWLKSPQRAESVRFSNPVIHTDNVYFHHKDLQFTWDDIDDIKPYRIGVTRGYSYGQELDAAIAAGKIRAVYADSDQENFRRLIEGEIDLFPADALVGKHIIESFFSRTGNDITFDEKALFTSPLYLIVGKKHPDADRILERFNQGLNRLKESGRFKDILSEMQALNSLVRMNFFTENYAPFNFLGNDNQLRGVAIDIFAQIFDELGLLFSIDIRSLYPWPRAYAEVQRVPNSAIFAITRTKEREDLFKWVGPIVRSNIVLTAKKSSDLFGVKPERGLRSKICVIREDVAEQILLSMGVETSSLAYANAPESCAKMLALQRVDFWAYGDTAATWYLGKEGYDLDLFEHTYLLKESSQYIGLNKSVPDTIVGRLQESLNYLKQTGQISQIMAKYNLTKLNKLEYLAR